MDHDPTAHPAERTPRTRPLDGDETDVVVVATDRPHEEGVPVVETAAADPGDDARGGDRSAPRRNPAAIREEDTEPYFGLQYVARLFKVAAMVVVVALVAEIIAGLALEGAGAVLGLITEVIRGVVLAAFLWGAGDLTILLIDVGHDVRAARVLLGRLSARAAAESMQRSQERG